MTGNFTGMKITKVLQGKTGRSYTHDSVIIGVASPCFLLLSHCSIFCQIIPDSLV